MPWILFFDEECGFCNQWVRRIVHWDRDGAIHFAPLQGRLAAQHQLAHHLDGRQASLILMNETSGAILSQSEAVLQVLRLLGGAWKCLLAFGLIPRSWRDRLYREIARNRHRLTREQPSVCEPPGKELADRMRE